MAAQSAALLRGIQTPLCGRWRISASRSKQIWSSNASSGKSHYEVLGLSCDATPQEIKAAFRRLVHKYHPDVNKEADAEDAFKCLRAAYEVLSNEITRKAYDLSLYKQRTAVNMDARREMDGAACYRSSELVYHRMSVYEENAYDRIPRRKRRRFQSSWIKQVRDEEPENLDDRDVEDDAHSKDLVADWESARSMVLIVAWFEACLWHVFGTRLALAALAAGMAIRGDVSVPYKVALAVTSVMGGCKGVVMAASVLVSIWVYGVAYDVAVLTVVLGVWFVGSVAGTYVNVPSVVLLLMARQLIRKGRQESRGWFSGEC